MQLFFLNCDPFVLLAVSTLSVINIEFDAATADDELKDSNNDVILGSASGNSQSDEAILSLFLSDTKESDFSIFLAKEDIH